MFIMCMAPSVPHVHGPQDMLRQNGISASEQSDMLRLDAMVMMVQLNIRNLLEARASCDASRSCTSLLVFKGRQPCW